MNRFIKEKLVDVVATRTRYFEHGDRAILVSDGLIYEGQIVERTFNNDFIYHKFFVMPLRAPLRIFDRNKTDMGLIFKITG
jgi:hypothetical protein